MEFKPRCYLPAPLNDLLGKDLNQVSDFFSKEAEEVFKVQTTDQAYIFMIMYFDKLAQINPQTMRKDRQCIKLINAYNVMLKHFLEESLKYTPDSIHHALHKLKLHNYVITLMDHNESNGMGHGDRGVDSPELTHQKAKAKELINLLTDYAAWYKGDRLMLRPCAHLVARKCESIGSMDITFPKTMTQLDEDYIPEEIDFNAKQDGKVCIIVKQGTRISAFSYELDRLRRSLNPRTSSALYFRCKGPVKHFNVNDEVIADNSEIFVELNKAIGFQFKAYINACTLDKLLNDQKSAMFAIEADPKRPKVVLAGFNTYKMNGLMNMTGEFHCEEGHVGSVYNVFRVEKPQKPQKTWIERITALEQKTALYPLPGDQRLSSGVHLPMHERLSRLEDFYSRHPLGVRIDRQMPMFKRIDILEEIVVAHLREILEHTERDVARMEAEVAVARRSRAPESVAPTPARHPSPRLASHRERSSTAHESGSTAPSPRLASQRERSSTAHESVATAHEESVATAQSGSATRHSSRGGRRKRRTVRNGARRSRKNAGARRARLSTKYI
jgi:hypothetical protein